MKSKEESYKIDGRRRSDILNQMQILAQSYTPEWKFDTTSPDAGSVIGLIFANQTAVNIQKLNRVIEKYHTEFANMYGISLGKLRLLTVVKKDSFVMFLVSSYHLKL